jgi:hypothetical protein
MMNYESRSAEIDNRPCVTHNIITMSTLVQIESAVADLPAQDQWSLLAWLQRRLKNAPPTKTAVEPEALRVFRELQKELALTAGDAAAWKGAVAEGRR